MLSPWKLRQAARVFHAGGLLAYPTESVFGLGCDPLNPHAVHRLLQLKQRPLHKGLILIAADYDQLRPFIRPLQAARMAEVFASWPGPHTWLLPAAPHLPRWLRGGHKTLAVRVTAHPVAAALCRACRSPLVSTSANLSGRPPARTPLKVRQGLGQQLEHIVNAPCGGAKRPSTIRNALTGALIRG